MQVYGLYFYNAASLACRFSSALTKVDVQAQWRSCTQITCVAPPQSPGAVEVSVTSNGVDYSPNSMSYTFTALLRLFSLAPSVGAAAGGGTVTVVGEAFIVGSAVACRS